MPYISKDYLDRKIADIKNNQVSLKSFGAVGDGMADDTVAIQKAVDYCLVTNLPKILIVEGVYRVSASININRGIDLSNSQNIFRVIGGTGGSAFTTSLPIPIFSSSLSVIDEVQTQCISFCNITFFSSTPYINSYVLDKSKFIRTSFNNCSFNGIKLLNTINYIQSIKLVCCDVRGWAGGCFIKAIGGAYDIKIDTTTVEHADGDFLNLTSATGSKGVAGCSVTSTMIEGINGTAITIDNALGFAVSSCYFEANGGVDIKLDTPANMNGPCRNLGIFMAGNYHSQSTANKQNLNYYSVRYGDCVGAVVGCFCDGKLGLLSSNSIVTTTGTFEIN